jgi:hypothetical protein
MRKLHIAVIALFAAAVIVPVTLALGATSAPAVTTAAATGVVDTSATLNGTVNPNGQQTSYAFQWGPTISYGHETPLTSGGAGTAATPVSYGLTGVSAGTTYHFRIIATSASGVSVGADQMFATTGTAPPSSAPPTAASGSASAVDAPGATLSATLTGTVNPAGQATTYYFEYGTTPDYGLETVAASAGAGPADVAVSAQLTGLNAADAYHYRVVAVSAGGTAVGSDQMFNAMSTGGVSAVSQTSATLNGVLNPQGVSTSYFFQFGTTLGYGLQTTAANAGAVTGNVAVHAYISGLVANTVYHYRLVGQSGGSTYYGLDHTFTTAGPSQTISTVKLMGRMGFVSPGGWIGVEVGCFAGQTNCAGHIQMSHDGTVVGQRDFNMRPERGFFENVKLTPQGKSLLRGNHPPNNLLAVDVSLKATNGQSISQVMHLANWTWR